MLEIVPRPDTTATAAGDDAAFTDGLGPGLRFMLLGRVEVHVDGHDVAPSAPRALQLLALLLLAEGRVVATDTIVAELWGDTPPARARSAVQTHVHQLRRSLRAAVPGGAAGALLRTRPPGYALATDPRRVDAHRFRDLCRAGREALGADRVGEAATALRAACELWAGPPMANVARGAVLAAEAVELLERRHDARTLRIDAEIDDGRHRELVGELGALTVAHPFDEALAARFIRVLGRAGRRSEAMGAYRRVRGLLDVELGVRPGVEVDEAYRELLVLGRPAAA